jgi:hypothetical protein
MSTNLILRTSTSPYGDTTKGSVLSQAELDGNFIQLKGEVIYSAQSSGSTVTLKKYNGDDITFAAGGDSLWEVGSAGNFSIKAKNDSGLDATGDYSVAEGYLTTASGYTSHAEGEETTASSDSSHAEGYGSAALERYSHAEGQQTTATGQASHAEGRDNKAMGDYSHAEGWASNSIG